MSLYRYRAARADGSMLSGLIPATDQAQALHSLVSTGLHPIMLEDAPPTIGPGRAASRRELAVLFQSLSSLVDAGVPLERAVAASVGLCRGALGASLGNVQRSLREGSTLATALEQSRGVVPGVVIGMLRAGERGGHLGTALSQAATQLEAEAELVARVRNALAYPAILTLAGLASVTVITTVVLPRFAALLSELGNDLPPTTRLLLGLSGHLSRFGLWYVLAGLAAGSAAIAWIRQPTGRAWLHHLLLELPIVGGLRLALATTRVTRALGAMLATGMPLLSALEAAGEAAGDLEVRARLSTVRERVARGEPLVRSLTHEAALIPMALQLLAVGEGSGQLGSMAMKAGDLAAREAERGIRTLVTLLEPALVIAFGGLVAFVAAALLQAVYGLRPG